VDKCDRLWVLDTGAINLARTVDQICPVKLDVFDLKTDRHIRRFVVPTNQTSRDSLFTNIVVDIANNNCGDAYAYMSDVFQYGLVVYSYKEVLKNASVEFITFNVYRYRVTPKIINCLYSLPSPLSHANRVSCYLYLLSILPIHNHALSTSHTSVTQIMTANHLRFKPTFYHNSLPRLTTYSPTYISFNVLISDTSIFFSPFLFDDQHNNCVRYHRPNLYTRSLVTLNDEFFCRFSPLYPDTL